MPGKDAVRCDPVLRVDGSSQGADNRMVEVAPERGLAVYHELRDVPGCAGRS